MRSTTVGRLAAAVAAALLVATACGEPGGSGGGGDAIAGAPGDDRAGPRPDTPVGSSPTDCTGAACDVGPWRWRRVEPRPGMADVHLIAFRRARPTGERAVLVRFYSGVEPCSVLDHVHVDYGDDAVTVTLYEGHEPGSENEVCVEVAEAKEVLVPLEEPLGDRAVRDGAPRGGDAPITY